MYITKRVRVPLSTCFMELCRLSFCMGACINTFHVVRFCTFCPYVSPRDSWLLPLRLFPLRRSAGRAVCHCLFSRWQL